MLDKDPFIDAIPRSGVSDYAFQKLLRETPKKLVALLPKQNPTGGQLSDEAFSSLTPCWNISYEERPTMKAVRDTYLHGRNLQSALERLAN